MDNETLLRLPQVLGQTGLTRAMLYSLAARGDFPQPIKLSARCAAWPQSRVSAWIESRIAAARDERRAA